MRGKTRKWREESIRACRGRCILSNKRYEVVHHIHGFNSILNEALDELQLPHYECIYEYDFKDLQRLTKLVVNKHYEYGLGVCLTEDLHNKFHQRYGAGNNTWEQFNEFTWLYKRGKIH